MSDNEKVPAKVDQLGVGVTKKRGVSPTPPSALTSSEQFRLATQSARLKELKEWARHVEDAVPETLSLESVRATLETIEASWTAFGETHDQLGVTCSTALLSHPYLTDDCYSQASHLRMVTRAKLLEWQAFFKETGPATGSTSARRTLPEISLPTFSGRFLEWLPFRDLFTSMVTDNPEITNVERMHYLRTSLTGEAAQLICNLPVSGDAFPSAWDLLVSRYDNRRVLISAHLDQLFDSASTSDRSSRALNQLLSNTAESLNALRSLGAPVDSWDLVLVHHLAHRLDNRTREAWEVKLGSSVDPPTFETLRNFLVGRARALESLERQPESAPARGQASSIRQSSLGSSRSAGGATVHATTATAPNSSSNTYPCSQCSGPHFIATCPKFHLFSNDVRRMMVEKHRLCYNCLGKHNVSACNSSKRCRLCGNKHHSLIHQHDQPLPGARSSSTVTSQSQPAPAVSTPSPGSSHTDISCSSPAPSASHDAASSDPH